MFEYLCGTIHFSSQEQIIIDVGGVGFAVYVTNSAKNQLTDGQTAKLYIHLHVREDHMRLYGFLTEQEREMFLKLQSVSGIGPALSLNILSTSTVQKVYEAIISEDVEFLKTIKGVGVKTATRLVVELKGGLRNMAMQIAPTSEINYLRSSAIKALMALGYQELEASQAVNQALSVEKNPKNLEVLVFSGLQVLQNKSIVTHQNHPSNKEQPPQTPSE